MKKFLLSVLLASATAGTFAQCSDLFISEYVEGSNNNKALEIYNPTNAPISMAGKYRLVRYNNGSSAAAAEANAQAMINLGNHVIAPKDVWVIVIDKRDAAAPCPGQDCAVSAALQAVADTFLCPDYAVSFAMYFNGNDALSLQKTNDGGATWQYVDIFGKMGDPNMVSGFGWNDTYPYDGSTGGPEWTENHTLIRKSSVMNGVTSNPTEFMVHMEYDSLPNQTWDSLGAHSCACNLVSVNDVENTVSVKVFPNPAVNGVLQVSATEVISTVEMFNVVGELAASVTPQDRAKATVVSTEGLAPGMYLVRMRFANNTTSVVKVSVQ